MSFNREQFKTIITQKLEEFGYGVCSPVAVNLLLGTAAQESRFGTYLYQLGGGPALGVFQMEPITEADIWRNYLSFKHKIKYRVTHICNTDGPDVDKLQYDLGYQIVMVRLQYYRRPEPLPAADDLSGLAKYYKLHFNSVIGKATEADFIKNYQLYVKG